MQTFKDVKSLQKFIRGKKKNFETWQRESLQGIGTYMRDKIRQKHGLRQPGWPANTAITGATPLFKTGKNLRNAVKFRTTRTKVEIYTSNPKLASIHEYWRVFKMTPAARAYLFSQVFNKKGVAAYKAKNPGYITIPARPIWRNALKWEQRQIEKLLEQSFKWVFDEGALKIRFK